MDLLGIAEVLGKVELGRAWQEVLHLLAQTICVNGLVVVEEDPKVVVGRIGKKAWNRLPPFGAEILSFIENDGLDQMLRGQFILLPPKKELRRQSFPESGVVGLLLREVSVQDLGHEIGKGLHREKSAFQHPLIIAFPQITPGALQHRLGKNAIEAGQEGRDSLSCKGKGFVEGEQGLASAGAATHGQAPIPVHRRKHFLLCFGKGKKLLVLLTDALAKAQLRRQRHGWTEGVSKETSDGVHRRRCIMLQA